MYRGSAGGSQSHLQLAVTAALSQSVDEVGSVVLPDGRRGAGVESVGSRPAYASVVSWQRHDQGESGRYEKPHGCQG